jgi:hypothetical protein
MRFRTVFVVLALALLVPVAAARQTPGQTQLSTDEIIRRFAAAESANKIARNNYTFTQDVDIMTIGEGGSITGRYKRVSDIVYDNLSNRIERITYFPPSTMKGAEISQEDLQDLAGVQPFALTTEDLPKYEVSYVGKEKLDELDTYIFDVRPRQIKKGERYLEGRIWVDDQDLQIVKVAGKGVPETEKSKYPRFESYRENIGGRYWFPTYVHGDDVLEFKHNPVHLLMTVRYTNYKKFSTDIRTIDEDEPETGGEVKGAEKNSNKSAPPKMKKPETETPKKRP